MKNKLFKLFNKKQKQTLPKRRLLFIPFIPEDSKKNGSNYYSLTITKTLENNFIGDLIVFEDKNVTLRIVTCHTWSPEAYDDYRRRIDDILKVEVVKGNIESLDVNDEYKYIKKKSEPENEANSEPPFGRSE